MPNKQIGESKDDFMKRCIPKMISEGKDQDVAVAACSSMYERMDSTQTLMPPKKRTL